MQVGVFDSGIGGQSVADAIKAALPGLTVDFRCDPDHMPYGTKPPEEVRGYVLPILLQMQTDGCNAIVIACNTITTTLIDDLRQHVSAPLVAIEPMVKPASAVTQSGIIAVCATPATLASARYQALKQQYAQGITVLEPDCSDWALMIEHDAVDDEQIAKTINGVIKEGADVIVLGCTHYHWIEEKIASLSTGKATILQPEQAIIEQLKRVIAQLNR